MTRSQTFRIAVRKFGPFEEAMRQQWQHLESTARTGLKLEIVSLDLHDLEDALFTQHGMVNGDWDIAFVNTDWIAAMHAQNCALDLAPLLEKDPPQDYPSGWTDSLLRLQRIDTAVLGVPFHDGPECLIYRKDLFEDPATQARHQQQFGEPLAPPRTWEAFHRTARFLHNPARKFYGTVFAAYADGHNTVYDFLLQLWTRNGELIDPAGNIRFATPEAERALTFYRELLADNTAVHPDCLTMDSVQSGQAFAAGNVAMMINWFGFAAMAHTSPATRGLVDIAEIPAEGQGTTASLNVYWLLAIASGSPHAPLAWQLLRHSLTPAMDRLTTTLGAIGCRKSTWRDSGVNRDIPFYHRIEQLHANAREIPRRADWPSIAAIIDQLVTATVTTRDPILDLLHKADAAASLL